MVTAEHVQDTVMLSIREAAARYGYPQATLYEMRLRGVPGFVTNGRNVRIHRPTFERWLEEQARGGAGDDRAA